MTRTDEAVVIMRETLLADPQVQALLGYEPRVLESDATHDYESALPLFEYTVISVVMGELWQDVRLQWDGFATDPAIIEQMEAAIYRLFHHDLPVPFGDEGESMFSQIVDRRVLPAPQGDRTFARSWDQIFSLAREEFRT